MPRRPAGPVQADPRGGAAPQGAAPHIAPSHVPVLLDEVRQALAVDRPGLAVDGTFGAGGYTRMLLEADPGVRVVAIDRDPGAIAAGADLARRAGGRLTLVEGRFGALDALVRGAGHEAADWVVLDVGVSSMQLDEAERGFSFRRDGPLDMRMARAGTSAADLVNEAPEAQLADIFFHYGEERRARAVARAVIEARRKAPVTRTGALAEIVAGIVRAEPGLHPATRVFQGLRIAVNDELGELVAALHAAEALLRPGGRLAVVTFHSLEDRIVKQFIAARSGRLPAASRHLPSAGEAPPRSLAPVTKGPVLPGEAECARNPRARSAKLRAAERTAAVLPPPVEGLSGLAALPERTPDRAPSGHRR